MIENTYNGRAKINSDGPGLIIRIPSKKNWFIILFLIAWLGGWYMGESSTIKELIASDDIGENGFLIFWLFGWTLGGLFAIVVLLWTIIGQETIIVEQSILKLKKGLLDLGLISKDYDLQSIKNFELSPVTSFIDMFAQSKKIGDFWGVTGGNLKFDYGMKTIKFGIGIDEAEAKYLLEQIGKRGNIK
jgi:hypothetical protein